ncbi:diacylglycerol kinase family lipid kinase [Neobacillus niacini]|uniref:diacylglycerol/lipid kinase family protein n=1 Tax=Neobacillus niacini TaxID=86668 RepID=UPI00285BDB46|nr:diacylglycerol kinase family lipid kinase [Neobacillus niacini]MDR7000511.1 YegS/Rv2252/BmrU family lipid kinase [Neobacillus niacini]
MKTIYFIINPKAGNGACKKVWSKIENQLKGEQIPYIAFFTDYPGHAKILAAQIAVRSKEQTIIIAVGGDGTMHEVVNGVVHYNNITLGFIPGGSGNDFSRGFQLPSEPELALKVLIRLIQKEAAVDIGKIVRENQADCYFINNMGVGFDALISYEVNRSKIKSVLNKRSLGRLVYVYFLLIKLFTYKRSTIQLSIDGKKHIFEHTWFVTVSNQPFYGGGMKIAPDAEPNDGVLDITVVHQLSRLKLLLVFISVFWGKHVLFKEVKSFKGKNIFIQSSSPLYAHADGEHIGYVPLKIQLKSKALKIVTRKQHLEEVDLKERDSNDFQ